MRLRSGRGAAARRASADARHCRYHPSCHPEARVFCGPKDLCNLPTLGRSLQVAWVLRLAQDDNSVGDDNAHRAVLGWREERHPSALSNARQRERGCCPHPRCRDYWRHRAQSPRDRIGRRRHWRRGSRRPRRLSHQDTGRYSSNRPRKG